MSKGVAGVGRIGVGKYCVKDHRPAYAKWTDMLNRCYNVKQYGYPQYGGMGVTVCDEWHNFQCFAQWATNQHYYGVQGYQLDKDILVSGNKEYRPEACCLVPKLINSAVIGLVAKSPLLTGVSRTSNLVLPFRARISMFGRTVNIGVYKTEIEAHDVYLDYKVKYIRGLAMVCRTFIDADVYESLSNWVPPYV